MKKNNDIYTIKNEIELGLFLKKIREERKLSLREVAERGDISSSYLNHLEIKNEKVGLPTVEYFNKLFNVYDLKEYEKEEFLKIYFKLILPEIFQDKLDSNKIEEFLKFMCQS